MLNILIKGININANISCIEELIDIRRSIEKEYDLEKARHYCSDMALNNHLYTWPEAYYISECLKETINDFYKRRNYGIL